MCSLFVIRFRLLNKIYNGTFITPISQLRCAFLLLCRNLPSCASLFSDRSVIEYKWKNNRREWEREKRKEIKYRRAPNWLNNWKKIDACECLEIGSFELSMLNRRRGGESKKHIGIAALLKVNVKNTHGPSLSMEQDDPARAKRIKANNKNCVANGNSVVDAVKISYQRQSTVDAKCQIEKADFYWKKSS